MPKYLISLSGSAGANIALIPTMFKAKQDILAIDPHAEIHYAAISGGIIPALAGVLGYDLARYEEAYLKEYGSVFEPWYKNTLTDTLEGSDFVATHSSEEECVLHVGDEVYTRRVRHQR